MGVNHGRGTPDAQRQPCRHPAILMLLWQQATRRSRTNIKTSLCLHGGARVQNRAAKQRQVRWFRQNANGFMQIGPIQWLDTPVSLWSPPGLSRHSPFMRQNLSEGSLMTYESYHKRTVGQHALHPETQMMGFGYDPHLSEGSLKPPVFLTST